MGSPRPGSQSGRYEHTGQPLGGQPGRQPPKRLVLGRLPREMPGVNAVALAHSSAGGMPATAAELVEAKGTAHGRSGGVAPCTDGGTDILRSAWNCLKKREDARDVNKPA